MMTWLLRLAKLFLYSFISLKSLLFKSFNIFWIWLESIALSIYLAKLSRLVCLIFSNNCFDSSFKLLTFRIFPFFKSFKIIAIPSGNLSILLSLNLVDISFKKHTLEISTKLEPLSLLNLLDLFILNTILILLTYPDFSSSLSSRKIK